uniref:Uncharacterized protein n=1 Tax=Arundo donax TaxID=35708 RepID=A0A0A9EB86_ARUDO
MSKVQIMILAKELQELLEENF